MQLNEKNLTSQEFLEKTESRAQEIMNNDMVHEASALIKSLEQILSQAKDFKKQYYYLYMEYKNVIIKLKWLILPMMDLEEDEIEIIDLFKNHFTKIFGMPGYDVWRKLKAYLITFLFFDKRDEFKKEIRRALEVNKHRLTEKKIVTDNQEREPTVGGWIIDYNSNLGASVVDNLKRVQYFTNNRNIKNLEEKEKNKVKTLLDLYERLKLSSNTLEGLEETIPVDEPGREGTIRGGVFEPYEKDEAWAWIDEKLAQIALAEKEATTIETKFEKLKQLAASYPPGSLERKAVEEEMNRVTHNS